MSLKENMDSKLQSSSVASDKGLETQEWDMKGHDLRSLAPAKDKIIGLPAGKQHRGRQHGFEFLVWRHRVLSLARKQFTGHEFFLQLSSIYTTDILQWWMDGWMGSLAINLVSEFLQSYVRGCKVDCLLRNKSKSVFTFLHVFFLKIECTESIAYNKKSWNFKDQKFSELYYFSWNKKHDSDQRNYSCIR